MRAWHSAMGDLLLCTLVLGVGTIGLVLVVVGAVTLRSRVGGPKEHLVHTHTASASKMLAELLGRP